MKSGQGNIIGGRNENGDYSINYTKTFP